METTQSKPAKSRAKVNGLAERIANVEAPVIAPVQEQVIPANGEQIIVHPEAESLLHLVKGRNPYKASVIAKQIDDSRSAIGRMVNRADFAGDKLTGSDKKGNVALWEGCYLRPCNSKTEVRCQAILKAAHALARALAMPTGDTL